MSGPGPYADDRERRLHARYRLLAAAAVDGRIDPEDAADLEAHLLTCDACSAELAAMRADHRLLAEPARVPPPDPRVRTAILDAARGPRVPRAGPQPRTWPALLAAGLIVAVIGTGILLGLRRPPTAGSGASAPSSPRPTATAPTVTPRPLGRGVPNGPCAPRLADLAAWWPGEPDGRELVAGRTAVLVNGAATTAGVVGSAFDFDGRAGYAEVASDPDLFLGKGDFTLLLWVRFDDTTGERVLIEQWEEGDVGARATSGWTFTKLEDDVLLFTSESAGAGQGGSTPVLGFEAGVWYHLAVRRSGSDFELYVNGAEIGGGRFEEPPLDLRLDRPLLMGRRGDDRGFLLDGALDEVQIVLGRALFEDEIRVQYESGAKGTCSG